MQDTINTLNQIRREYIDTAVAHIERSDYDAARSIINELKKLDRAIEALQPTLDKMYPDSTNIYYADYDSQTKTLRIRFQSSRDAIYVYDSFPEFYWEQFKKAASKGHYFNRVIKDKFPYERFN